MIYRDKVEGCVLIIGTEGSPWSVEVGLATWQSVKHTE